jgi:hypothetical protein
MKITQYRLCHSVYLLYKHEHSIRCKNSNNYCGGCGETSIRTEDIERVIKENDIYREERADKREEIGINEAMFCILKFFDKKM